MRWVGWQRAAERLAETRRTKPRCQWQSRAISSHFILTTSSLLAHLPLPGHTYMATRAVSRPLKRCLSLKSLHPPNQGQKRCLSGSRSLWQQPSYQTYRKIPGGTRLSSSRKNGPPRARGPAQPQPEAPIVPVNTVDIQLDGQSQQFSTILLRDLCECPRCVDPSTKQKYYSTTDIPAAIRPRAVALSDTGVGILWDGDIPGYDKDHTTNIPIDILRQYAETACAGLQHAATSKESRVTWDAASYAKLPDFSYEAYMQSEKTLYDALEQLHTHGLAFLTNVPESEKSVSAIAERIGPVKNTFYGYTWDVRSVPEAKNVAYTSQDLGFHMDLLYMEQPPHLQFLHCIRSSSAGGASLFTDSFRSACDLFEHDIQAFDVLQRRRVNFHYNHPSTALYHHQRRVFEAQSDMFIGGIDKFVNAHLASRGLRPDVGPKDRALADMSPIDYIDAVSWSPPFQAYFGKRQAPNATIEPMARVNQAVAEWHMAASKFNELIHRPEMVYERLMKPGECVLFDNRRVLHARKAFEVGDAGKERWLRGAYLDKDPYLSKLRVLRHRFKGRERAALADDYWEAAAEAA